MHRMSCIEWGDPHNPRVLICAHGLTRNGRDFDDLAQALSQHYRVICPDVVGRGHSDWLLNKLDYQIPQYAMDMILLLRQIKAKQVDWVGTSMGGLIGMGIASQRPNLIGKLVLNDVGPVITASSIQRIGQYVGRAPDFKDIAEAEAFIRTVSQGFGNLSDKQWRHLTESSVMQTQGVWRMRYDPGIGDTFRLNPPVADIDVWPVYDIIRAPTLVMRGVDSDLLRADTIEEMTRRGPRAKAVQIPGVGHAPTLMDESQIAIVRDFLLQDSRA
ncbi:MAG: alpha/beta hydrolase [Rhodocyclaceae bacterium]